MGVGYIKVFTNIDDIIYYGKITQNVNMLNRI